MKLPDFFIQQTRQVMGDDRFNRFLEAFEQEPPVSIRVNPWKVERLRTEAAAGERELCKGATPVPWCQDGYYLPSRPNFTFDPLFHAGLYYVQEASSMFLAHVYHQVISSPPRVALDLCAAPGGKSTLLRSLLPEACVLISNEPVATRAQVLLENIQKWGHANSVVTNSYPRDFRRSGMQFDLILCDVPCSGEGMFRKDEATIGEWSPQNVVKCSQLQREIVADAWSCLHPGGTLIYSTCTFNSQENEENIRWMMEELGAKVLPVSVSPEWNITGSLLPGFQEPVFRFIPGITRGEGIFMCALRKEGTLPEALPRLGGVGKALRVLTDGHYPEPTTKGHTLIPSPTEALRIDFQTEKYPQAELSYQQAMSYLRHEAIVLSPDTPRGFVAVTFMGVPLGFVKNIGSRANNHYPDPWKIKTTHIPQDYEAILRHT